MPRSRQIEVLRSLDSPAASAKLAHAMPGYRPLCSDMIAGLRLRRGYTPERLASEIGVSRNAIGSWERGDHPPVERRIQIAEVLKADANTREAIVNPHPAWGSHVNALIERDAEPEEWRALADLNWHRYGDLCLPYRMRDALWPRAKDPAWATVLHEVLDYASKSMWPMGYLNEAMHWWERGLSCFERQWRTQGIYGRAIVFRHLPHIWESPALVASRLREEAEGILHARAWTMVMAARAYALANYEKLALECLADHDAIWADSYWTKDNLPKPAAPTHYAASVWIRLGKPRFVLEHTRTDEGVSLDPFFAHSLRADAAMRIGDWSLGACEMEAAQEELEGATVLVGPLRQRSEAYMRRTWIEPLQTALKTRTCGECVGTYRNWAEDLT